MQEQTIFIEAMEILDPAERAAFLDRVCGSELALRQRVEKLLQRHQQDDSFLKNPAITPGATGEYTLDPAGKPTATGPIEQSGTVIGPYKLLRQIGEGGMGTVYLAEQTQPVQRKVALKIIKPGMASRQVIARFEAERQALALMDHPNIAKVLDAGATPAGRPYFVMDLIKGVPITKYCDEVRLNPRARLELLLPVCQAVQHAHQKGIIHRDLKPSNVIVALYDGKPTPKVIDFGVAKAAGQSLTEKTLVTGFGAVVGTLEYMSPEQAELNNQDIDTRSDIYSLGVLLYELLTGTTPLERTRAKEMGLLEALRLIREEETPHPSMRLSTAEELPRIAACRGLEPKKLSGLVRHELDWIVMKALDKDRSRRYDTAAGLALDVQRYLANEPVQACPPSTWYRFRKFARRNKAVLLTATVFGLGVLLSVVLLAVSNAMIGQEQQETKKALAAETRTKEELERTLERERRSGYSLRLALAHKYWWAQEADLAKQYLWECPPDLRDREWHALHRSCYGELLRFKVSSMAVHASRYSHNGLFLATGGGEITQGKMGEKTTVEYFIRVWDATTGQRCLTLQGHSVPIEDLAFSPDGKRLISVGMHRSILKQTPPPYFETKVWDLASGKEVSGFKQLASNHRVVVSPDARRIASALRVTEGQSRTWAVWIWDATTGEKVTGPLLDDPWFHQVAWNPDGNSLAAAAHDSLTLWNTEPARKTRTLLLNYTSLNSLIYSPNGERLAAVVGRPVGTAGGDVKVWDVRSGEEVFALHVPTGRVGCAAFSPDGSRLAWVATETTVVVWDVDANREALAFRGQDEKITCLTFSPDGRRLASTSMDGTVRIWDVTPVEEAQTGAARVRSNDHK